MNDPIRLFIGTSSNGEDKLIESVYEYTLRKNTKRDLQITWMRQTNNSMSYWHGFKTERWPTPFSGYRWAIPELCKFEGRALYTDVDMINFKDIGDLWDSDLEGKPFAARKGKRFGGHEFCVMVIDCEKASEILMPVSRQKMLPEFHVRMINSFSGNDSLVKELDPRWNCLDGEDRKVEDIWQLHWTKMATQPWQPQWFTGEIETHPRPDLVDLLYSLQKEANSKGYFGCTPEPIPVTYDIIGR